MQRREFITLLGGTALAWPLAARAQQAERVRRVGVLISNTENDPEALARTRALEHGLQKLGLAKGRNIAIDYFWDVSGSDRVNRSVRDVIQLNPDVILAHTPATTVELKKATVTIPIIFVQAADPINLGLVTNLASPSGNVTGFVLIEPSLGGKWLQLLCDGAPQTTRALVLYDDGNPSSPSFLNSIDAAAPQLGVSVSKAAVGNAAEIERAMVNFAGSNSGLIVLPGPAFSAQRDRIIELAAFHRLPAIYPFKFWATSGGLMSYSADNIDQWRQAASYIDRIFRGVQVRDLPIQLPTKFDLVINLKAAKALGLTLPRDFLLIADEVIE
jgi:putative tryptophan/tyrosine transport system substrate-binding protein